MQGKSNSLGNTLLSDRASFNNIVVKIEELASLLQEKCSGISEHCSIRYTIGSSSGDGGVFKLVADFYPPHEETVPVLLAE